MARFLYRNLSDFLRKWGNMLLAFSWILGLCFGVSVFSDFGHFPSSLMPAALSSRLSITGLLISVFLPFLFSAFAVYISQPVALPLVCFAKAFNVSFVSCGISSVYCDSAWVIRLLVLFHDFLACAMLFYFSMRHISCKRPLKNREVLCYILGGIFASAAEYYVFSPFLTELIEF